MAVPTHFRFTARGVFVGTPETWNFGWHMRREVAQGGDAGTADVNQSGVTAALSAFIQSGNGIIADNVQLTDWRAYVIGTDGRMEGNPLVVDLTTSNIKGTATVRYPPQIALAATLVADNRGPARFGRFYIPGPAKPIAGDSRMIATDAQQYSEHVVTLLKAVSSAIDLPGTIASAPAVNVSTRGGSTGTLQDVDHVEVGRALDTLRSRRRSLLEDRFISGQIDW